jgi:hypothetical protein
MGKLFVLLLILILYVSGRTNLVTPVKTMELSDSLTTVSGLILWDDRLWAHNDREDRGLYSLDPSDGTIFDYYMMGDQIWPRPEWEDISQDGEFLYVGDMGNNTRGNRRDLHILRFSKEEILQDDPVADTIHYSYSDQVNFHPIFPNTTRFDCEAFFVTADSIYLFTKQWIRGKTSVYSLPKSPGTYRAQLKSTHYVGGMITGATRHHESQRVVLSGYSFLIQPFLIILSDYSDNNYFTGNKQKIKLDLPFHQIEGIATRDGIRYYISNERSYIPKVHKPQKLHLVDLEKYLN